MFMQLLSITLMFLFSQASLADEIIWAQPSQITIEMTRGNELPQSSRDFFGQQNAPQCRENSQRVTVYIQVRNYSGNPTYLTVSQFCPESDELQFLRNVRDGRVPRGRQVGIWREGEPLSSPNEYGEDSFRTRGQAAAQADYDRRMAETRERIEHERNRLNLLEGLVDCYAATVGAPRNEGSPYNCESTRAVLGTQESSDTEIEVEP